MCAGHAKVKCLRTGTTCRDCPPVGSGRTDVKSCDEVQPGERCGALKAQKAYRKLELALQGERKPESMGSILASGAIRIFTFGDMGCTIRCHAMDFNCLPYISSRVHAALESRRATLWLCHYCRRWTLHVTAGCGDAGASADL